MKNIEKINAAPHFSGVFLDGMIEGVLVEPAMGLVCRAAFFGSTWDYRNMDPINIPQSC